MASNILPLFPNSSVHEDIFSVGPRWKKWFQRFEMYLAAHAVKNTTGKRALLLWVTLKAGTVERRNDGMAENDPKS